MRKTTLASFLSIVLCSSCAVSPDELRSALETISPCCRSVAEIPITNALGSKDSIAITSQSPVFDFPTGRSHFASFALPDDLSNSVLELRTFVGTPTVVNGVVGHVSFFPAVTFLSGRHEPIGMAYDEQLAAELYGWSGQGSFVGHVKIPENAKFAILHTIPKKLGLFYVNYAKSPGMTVMVGGIPVEMGTGLGPMRTVFVSTGTVMVSIK